MEKRSASKRLDTGAATAVGVSRNGAHGVARRPLSEERLLSLLETVKIMPWEADAESAQFIYAGDQACKMFGYPIEHWYEPDFWPNHLHPDDRDEAIAFCENHSARLDHYEFEYRMLAHDGRIVWVRDLVNVVRENGKPTTICGFKVDITERKQTEDALRNLSSLLIRAQEDERRRVARELHDDLNQRMALLSIELEQLGQQFAPGERELNERIHSLRVKTQEISTEIHRISYRLHPSQLDHLGLAAALKSFCVDVAKSHDLQIEFFQTGFPADLSQDVTLGVFRIAQESLRNVIKHSGARSARVVLERNQTELRLTVSDQGCGFEVDSPAIRRGLGFVSMSERLRLLGGDFSIQSAPQQGTQIIVIVPLSTPGNGRRGE
jgi:PAS domain S-box-containing protein